MSDGVDLIMDMKTPTDQPATIFDMDTSDVTVEIGNRSASAARNILTATSRSIQVERFTAYIKDIHESPDDLRLLFATLGVSITADLVSATVEPATYSDWKHEVDFHGKIADCVESLVRGLAVLGQEELVSLVDEWAKAEHFNRFLAVEIFAAAESALATAFSSAAIAKCLESTSISVARALAASASHVLSLVPGVDLCAILVSLLRSSNKYDMFLSLALGGETELPLLADMACNPKNAESTLAHREFGRVQQLLTSARACLRDRFDELPLDIFSNLELAEEYERVAGEVDIPDDRILAVETEIEQRSDFVTLHPGPGLIHFFGKHRGAGPHYAFNANLTPDIAEKFLRNVSEGKKPFEEDDRKESDGVYWFESPINEKPEDDGARRPTWIPVEIVDDKPSFTLNADELANAYEEQMTKATAALKAKLLSRYKAHRIDNTAVVTWYARRIAEREVWKFVGAKVVASDEGIGLLELKAPPFDDVIGSFIVVRDPSDVHVPDAVPRLVETLVRHGMEAEPYVLKAASVLIATMKEAGQVRAAFQIGGRVLLVIKLAKDTYKIVHARNKVKASVEVIGGWAGAAAAGSTFAHFFVPAHLMAGPAGWAMHGIGTVLAGAFGYWIGTSVCTWAYELVVIEQEDESKPKDQ